MKKIRRKLIFLFLIISLTLSPFSFSGFLSETRGVTIETITGTQEWKENRAISGDVIVEAGATLIIDKGVQVNISQYWTNIEVYGTLIVRGTLAEPVIFTSDLTHDAFTLRTQPGSNVFIEGAIFEKGGYSAFLVNRSFSSALAGNYTGAITIAGGVVDVVNTLFRNNSVAMIVEGESDVHINYSSFENNQYDVESTVSTFSSVDFKYNWWGTSTGPTQECYIGMNNQETCYYNTVSQGVDFSEWLTNANLERGASNVLFLPGIKASHLYKQGMLGTEDELWLPNYFGNDMADLTLDTDGKSVNNVYTRDVLSTVPNGNLYKTFLDDLATLKNNNTINDYEAFAYDWRQSAEDVAKNGTPYENMTKSLVSDVQTLAENSKSHKVTIVAHSNGGLVAKALMIELENLKKSRVVDKIIFVGTPEMGTPLATLSMLYGYDESILAGSLVSRSDARTLVENMPGAYGLLPSEKYFSQMKTPFIDFSKQNNFKKYKDAYGDTIDTFSEFKNFLLGTTDHRTKPAKDDVEAENILNQKLLDETVAMHGRLDVWTPPLFVRATEIAGWGLDTVSGIRYTEKEKIQCFTVPGPAGGAQIPSCTGMGQYEPLYEPEFTVDGDKVVVAPSALSLPEAFNVKKYWMNLYYYNNNTNSNRNHKNLLEIESIESIIKSIVKNVNISSLPRYISITRPDDYAGANPRLHMALYSPLDIHLYDTKGNHTGPVEKTDVRGVRYTTFEENIPNSSYYQIGERKYVSVPAGVDIHIAMHGYADGAYTFRIEEISDTADGEVVGTQALFEKLPTKNGTQVDIDVSSTGLDNISSLKADWDNDGTVDYEVPAKIVSSEKDDIAPEVAITFDPETQQLNIRGVDDGGQDVSVVLTDRPNTSKIHTKERRKMTDTVATLTDKSGNVTELVFQKKREKRGDITFILESISYNGEKTLFTRNMSQYRWHIVKKKHTQLQSHFDWENREIESRYIPKRNETRIKEEMKIDDEDTVSGTDEEEVKKVVLPGIVIPSILTEVGKIKIIY